MSTQTLRAVVKHLTRKDGSEVRITANPCYSAAGLHASLDVFVHHRNTAAEPWALASDRPHPDWRTMSVADYIQHGRSKVLQLVSPGELLAVRHEALVA